jgi:hypothetical protein
MRTIAEYILIIMFICFIFSLGYALGEMATEPECYFNGHADSEEEAQLYTRLDEIIRGK